MIKNSAKTVETNAFCCTKKVVSLLALQLLKWRPVHATKQISIAAAATTTVN